MRTARTAAIATLSIGGLVALAAWSALIADLLAWEAPRVAVVPPMAGAVLPCVEIVRPSSAAVPTSASAAPDGERPTGAGVVQAGQPASASPSADESPVADRRLRQLMDALQARLDAQRELVRARTTGTAPPRIPLPRDVVTCGGIRTRGARRIAYLVDCSAQSQPHIDAMIEEVMRSAGRLDDAQSFAVIACRKDWAEVAPPGAMRKAGSSFGSAVAADLRSWLRESAAADGPPQVYAGIEAAMRTRPDLVVLVSAGLANPGDGDDVRDAALGALDRANPRDARSGLRPARVMTLVAGAQDPKGVLSAIAAAHARDAPLHGTLATAAPVRTAPEVSAERGAAPADSDARLIGAMRLALSDPADPASARALLEAAVIAESAGWPREHVVRMANAAARRAEALGLDEIASEAEGIARRASEGHAR